MLTDYTTQLHHTGTDCQLSMICYSTIIYTWTVPTPNNRFTAEWFSWLKVATHVLINSMLTFYDNKGEK